MWRNNKDKACEGFGGRGRKMAVRKWSGSAWWLMKRAEKAEVNIDSFEKEAKGMMCTGRGSREDRRTSRIR